MAKTVGSIVLPQSAGVHRTSQLENDSRFSSVYEYILDNTTLNGTVTLNISGIPVNTVIIGVELYVVSPVVKTSTDESSMSISAQNNGSESTTVLMGDTWNDPSSAGIYSTDCYFLIKSAVDTIYVTHNLSTCTSGTIVLRLVTYRSPYTYEGYKTFNGMEYSTVDGQSIDVIN